MTVDNLVQKLKVMLGASTEEVVVVENTEAQFAEATLVDGTIVKVEGELESGKALVIETEEGEIAAPVGVHETTDGLIITVGEGGVIESIEEKEGEAEPVEAQEEEVEEFEAEVTEEVATEEVVEAETQEEQINAEQLLESIADIIKPYATEIEDLKTQLVTLSERFEAISDEPATAPIKRTFSEEARMQEKLAQSKFERLVAMRNKK